LFVVVVAKECIDTGVMWNLSDVKYDMWTAGVPVSAVVTALKQFFSELHEPVIPVSLYDDLRDAVSKSLTTHS